MQINIFQRADNLLSIILEGMHSANRDNDYPIINRFAILLGKDLSPYKEETYKGVNCHSILAFGISSACK